MAAGVKPRFNSVTVEPIASIATLVSIRGTDILLGADLEEHGQVQRGWTAVIASENRPQRKADIFKVAHHGGESAHHDRIWTELLVDAPFAVLTPWNRGSKLPQASDVARILRNTQKAFATSRATSVRRANLPPAVLRTIREGGITLRDAEPPTGYVKFRKIIGADFDKWTVELSSSALALQKYQ
jgi:hypothetical protein